jgi:ATP-dependent DNA helicase RecG
VTIDPSASVENLSGVGPKLQGTLAKLGIYRYIDLLLHLPLRYQDRSKITALGHLDIGAECLVEGVVSEANVVYRGRRSLAVTITDGVDELVLRFFYFSRYQQAALKKGRYVRAFGEVRFYGRDRVMVHPEYTTHDAPPPPPTPELTPVYPLTQGLTQQRIRKLTKLVSELAWPEDDGTPYAKLRFLHQPDATATMEDTAHVQEDVALDELTAYYLVMKGRALKRRKQSATPLPQSAGLGRELLRALGFKLTKAQARVVSEVLTDLDQTVPMLRLVQGDVGSGKTVVAAFAAIRAAEHDCQTALMAPTELLAEQHYLNFSNWLEPLGIRVSLLTGQLTAKEQRARLEAVCSGDTHVVIGTHALFQERVEFRSLALSIIDEQHRFGVHQRMALKEKSRDDATPHQLIMTATPIPRTLTMALYADMDVSVIDELPQGRQPITTHTVDESKRPEVIRHVDAALDAGQQAYWVCTLIDESDEIDATAATTLFTELETALPRRRLALLHGRMKSDEKLSVMLAFKRHELDLLVATTVIEVGVDVPNATSMVIENAERLGLAQLHQLRGRVGRGSVASHCYLSFKPGLGAAAKTRLNAMRESQDGFYLAEQDLKLRGPGDILGTRQAGEQTFRIADLAVHAHLMPTVIERGERLLRGGLGAAERAEAINLLRVWAPPDEGHLTV